MYVLRYALFFGLATLFSWISAPSAEAQTSLSRQEVVQLQGMLSDMGYSLSVDGVAGPGTRRALAQFNRDTTPAGVAPPPTIVNQDALFRVRYVFQRQGGATVRAAPESSVRPSFDCSRASIPSEFAICGDAQLAGLDNAIARAYNAALSRMSSSQRAAFRADQRNWLAFRNRCGANVGCLRAEMDARLNFIR